MKGMAISGQIFHQEKKKGGTSPEGHLPRRRSRTRAQKEEGHKTHAQNRQ